jgi:hypothetical protein
VDKPAIDVVLKKDLDCSITEIRSEPERAYRGQAQRQLTGISVAWSSCGSGCEAFRAKLL